MVSRLSLNRRGVPGRGGAAALGAAFLALHLTGCAGVEACPPIGLLATLEVQTDASAHLLSACADECPGEVSASVQRVDDTSWIVSFDQAQETVELVVTDVVGGEEVRVVVRPDWGGTQAAGCGNPVHAEVDIGGRGVM